MTLLEFVDLLVGRFLGVLHRLTYLVPPLMCLVGCGVLVCLLDFFGSVFRVAPRLLRRAFGLIYNSLIGEFLVSECLPNLLLDLAYSLLDLARRLILIHCFSPCLNLSPQIRPCVMRGS